MAKTSMINRDKNRTALVIKYATKRAELRDKVKNVKLSDYKGQWVVVCFYPGDFTFV